jgi:hypothetical protein
MLIGPSSGVALDTVASLPAAAHEKSEDCVPLIIAFPFGPHPIPPRSSHECLLQLINHPSLDDRDLAGA